MKKMPYAIIFLIVLAVLVFAGCKSFSSGSGDDDASSDSAAATEEPAGATEAPSEVIASEPVTEKPDAQPSGSETPPTDPAEVTDANGETVYTPEEISSIREEISARETTEKPSDGTDKPDAPGTETKAPETPSGVPANNKYDMLRSGTFYLSGSMHSDGQTNPVVLALDDNLVYMQATSDDLSMGFLIMDKTTYLLNPTAKTYSKLNSVVSSVLQEAGMMSEAEIRSMVSEFGFSTMKPLSEADAVNAGTFGSRDCTIYTFKNEDDGGKRRVYMNGADLLAIEKVSAEGKVDTAIYVNTLTDTIPTLPPADYSSQNLIAFISDISDKLDS